MLNFMSCITQVPILVISGIKPKGNFNPKIALIKPIAFDNLSCRKAKAYQSYSPLQLVRETRFG